MYPIIRLTQEDPYERGLEYGRQAREKIEICVESVSYTHLYL